MRSWAGPQNHMYVLGNMSTVHLMTYTHTHTSTILSLPHHTHSTTPLTPSPKIWEVRGAADKRPLSEDQFGQFDSSKVYLVQYLHPPPSTLVVYVWVGGEVGEGEEKRVKDALQHAETMAPNTRKVRMKYRIHKVLFL